MIFKRFYYINYDLSIKGKFFKKFIRSNHTIIQPHNHTILDKNWKITNDDFVEFCQLEHFYIFKYNNI